MDFFTFFTPQRRAAGSDDGPRSEVEQALASKSELLSTVLENVGHGIVMFDRSRRLLVWNNRYQQILRFPDGFLQVGLSNRELALYLAKRGDYGDGDPLKLAAERLHLLWSGEESHSEITILDENIYDVLFQRTDDGALVITYTNITERKRAEAALRVSEQSLANAQRLAHLGHWDWDIASGNLYMSDEAFRIYGFEPQAFSATLDTCLQAIHPDDRDRVSESVDRTISSGRPFNNEFRILRPDGTLRHVHERGEASYGDDGAAVRLSGTVYDITERKRAEAALRESEARLSKAAEMAKVGYWVWDEIKDKAVYCSDEVAEITGVATGRELTARLTSKEKDMEWVHPDDRSRLDKLTRQSKTKKTGYDIEFRIIRPDGAVRHLREILEPVLDDVGNLVRSNGIIQDITELKQAEDQLRQAQKMESLGQLTGGVAHDFNNLLAVILGNAELVADKLGEGDKQVQAMVHAATRGAELTQRLLSFSRQQALRPQSVDLNACVTGMTDMLRRTLGETIEIEPIIASGLSASEVDPGQLESALLNLAVNARDAMPKGGKLTIETANVQLDDDYAAAQGDVTPGHFVRLSVTDTGTGIPPDQIEHVFEPFFTTKEVGQGSGLGLSMVFGFAKQSGGHVTISSEPGCGTTVRLYLPQAEAPAQPAGQEPTLRDPKARGETILVVEDDPDVRALAISLLQRFGYNVLEAGDGTEALATLQAVSRIDLLFSDVVLPGGMSGPDLAAQVRDLHPGIKVLFTSGYPDAPHHRSPLFENTDLLAKPFGKRDLAQKVRAVLNG
jgi:PAS domain S-box-containing protein